MTKARKEDNHYSVVYANSFSHNKQSDAVKEALEKTQEYVEARCLTIDEQEEFLFVIDGSATTIGKDLDDIKNHPSFAGVREVEVLRTTGFGRLDVHSDYPPDRFHLIEDSYLSKVIAIIAH